MFFQRTSKTVTMKPRGKTPLRKTEDRSSRVFPALVSFEGGEISEGSILNSRIDVARRWPRGPGWLRPRPPAQSPA